MSWFGDGTLKQDLLESIEFVQQKHKVSAKDLLIALLEVLVYLAGGRP